VKPAGTVEICLAAVGTERVISHFREVSRRVRASMNRNVQTVFVAILIVALFLLVIIYGFYAFVIVTTVGFVVFLLIEQAYLRRKKKTKS
jgi:fatty acid desaturase